MLSGVGKRRLYTAHRRCMETNKETTVDVSRPVSSAEHGYMRAQRILVESLLTGLSARNAQSGQAGPHAGDMLLLRNGKSLCAYKRAAYAAHALLSSELACRYYFEGHTFAYPPQSPRVLQATCARKRCTWPWWRRAVPKLRRWCDLFTPLLAKNVFFNVFPQQTHRPEHMTCFR